MELQTNFANYELDQIISNQTRFSLETIGFGDLPFQETSKIPLVFLVIQEKHRKTLISRPISPRFPRVSRSQQVASHGSREFLAPRRRALPPWRRVRRRFCRRQALRRRCGGAAQLPGPGAANAALGGCGDLRLFFTEKVTIK